MHYKEFLLYIVYTNGGSVRWNMSVMVNTLRPRQNGRHFPDDIFKCIFLNESIWNSIEISLKFAPKSPINNIPALVGSDNGLALTRRQAIIWTNAALFIDAYMHHSASMS